MADAKVTGLVSVGGLVWVGIQINTSVENIQVAGCKRIGNSSRRAACRMMGCSSLGLVPKEEILVANSNSSILVLVKTTVAFCNDYDDQSLMDGSTNSHHIDNSFAMMIINETLLVLTQTVVELADCVR